MKKILLIAYILLSGTLMFAQIDSTQFSEIIISGGVIANQIYPKPWIHGIANEVVSGIIVAISSFIYGLFHRKREIKKLKKEGKLK